MGQADFEADLWQARIAWRAGPIRCGEPAANLPSKAGLRFGNPELADHNDYRQFVVLAAATIVIAVVMTVKPKPA